MSCWRAFTSGATAMIAVQPQIAVPAASSRRMPGDTPNNWPIATPAISATAMQAITTGTATELTPASRASVRRRPISAMPIRSSRRLANSSPGSAQAPTPARFRHRMPARIASRMALTCPPAASAPNFAAIAIATAKARPGRVARTALRAVTARLFAQRPHQLLRVVHHAPLDRAVHLREVADVRERVGVEDHEVREPAGLDLARLRLEAHRACAADGRAAQHFERRHARLDHDPHLAMDRRPVERADVTRVRAHDDLDAGVHQPAQVLPRGLRPTDGPRLRHQSSNSQRQLVGW